MACWSQEDDGGDIVPPTPQWWIILWSTRGILVAGLVLLLDPYPWLAVPWALAGIVVGYFGMKAIRPFASPLLDWYTSLNPDAGLQHRMFMLIDEGRTESAEFKQSMAEKTFWMCLPIPPLAGLFHGVLFGAVGGVLCGLDSASGISAASTAALGLLIGPVFVAFVAAITLACIVHPIPGLSLRVRVARRGLLVVSPLLIIPCGWYCLQTVVQRRRAAESAAPTDRPRE